VIVDVEDNAEFGGGPGNGIEPSRAGIEAELGPSASIDKVPDGLPDDGLMIGCLDGGGGCTPVTGVKGAISEQSCVIVLGPEECTSCEAGTKDDARGRGET
jgi:hypothetical protein